MSKVLNTKFNNNMSIQIDSEKEVINIQGLEISKDNIKFSRGIDGNINNLCIKVKDKITQLVKEITIENFFSLEKNKLDYLAFANDTIMVNEVYSALNKKINSVLYSHNSLNPHNLKFNHLFNGGSIYHFENDSKKKTIEMNVKGNQRVKLKVEEFEVVQENLMGYLDDSEHLIVDCIEVGALDSTSILRGEDNTDILVFKKNVYPGSPGGGQSKQKVIGIGTIDYDKAKLNDTLEILYKLSTDTAAGSVIDSLDEGTKEFQKHTIKEIGKRYNIAGLNSEQLASVTTYLILAIQTITTGIVEGKNKSKLEGDLKSALQINDETPIVAGQIEVVASSLTTFVSGIAGIAVGSVVSAAAGSTIIGIGITVALTGLARAGVATGIQYIQEKELREGIEELMEANGLAKELYSDEQAQKDAYIKEYIQAGKSRENREIILEAVSYRDQIIDSKNYYENYYKKRSTIIEASSSSIGIKSRGIGDDDNNVIVSKKGYQNELMGNDGHDALYGAEYDDTLNGGGGDDLLFGGDGNDTYEYTRGDGIDIISDSGGDDDKLVVTSSESITIHESGNDIIVNVDRGQIRILDGVQPNSIERIELISENNKVHVV